MHKLAINRKLKTLLLLPLMLLSTFALVGAISVNRVYAVSSLALQPQVINDNCSSACTHNVGAKFAYTVNATGIGGATGTIFAFQYEIAYNPVVLQAVNVSSYGPFFDTLLGAGGATAITSIDNVNGLASVAVSSLGPSSPAARTTLILGKIFFSVASLGRSDQSLVNSILVHNAGGGVLNNIPVTTTGAVFSNTGLIGIALWPCQSLEDAGNQVGANDCPLQSVFPEQNVYNYTADTGFTPGCLDFFGNVNSTGTLSVIVKVEFSVRSLYGSRVLDTPKTTLAPGQLSVVPLHTCFSPITSAGVVQTGSYSVTAKLLYQQINLDGSVTSVLQNRLVWGFSVKVVK